MGTAKHKKSDKAIAKKMAKLEKKNAMECNEEEAAPALSEEEKAKAKMERKKLNAHKMHYKKQDLNCTPKRGPRSIH